MTTPSARRNDRVRLAIALSCLFALSGLSGCALHYYDPRSGTEHVWGIGHMKMKVTPPTEGVQAVVSGTETLGTSLRLGREDYSFSAGWDYRRTIVVGKDASVRFEWPDGDFFNVRVGSKPPTKLTANHTNTHEEK